MQLSMQFQRGWDQKYHQEFQEYCDPQKIYELSREHLGIDADG
jgi:hypothetical protein